MKASQTFKKFFIFCLTFFYAFIYSIPIFSNITYTAKADNNTLMAKTESVPQLPYINVQATLYSQNFENIFLSPEKSYANIYYNAMKHDNDIQSSISKWNFLYLAANPSEALTGGKLISEQDMYKLALFDLFGAENTSTGIIPTISNNAASLEVDMVSSILEKTGYSMDDLKSLAKTDEIVPYIKEASLIHGMAEAYDVIDKIFTSANDIMDMISDCVNYQAISNIGEHIEKLLGEIAKDTTNPKELRNAALNCITYFAIDDDEVLSSLCIASTTIKSITTIFIDNAWGKLVESVPILRELSLVAKGIWVLTDSLFKFEQTSQDYYLLKATVGVENAVRKVIANCPNDYTFNNDITSAEYYMTTVEMFKNTVLMGMDCCIKLLETQKNAPGVFILDFFGVGNYDEAIEHCETQIENIKNFKKDKIENFNQFESITYNFYLKTYGLTTDLNKIQIGNYIELGKYNGESIIWRCVDIDENGPLLLSDKILFYGEYDAPGNNDYYHTDGWGWVRKEAGSNCWYDSNIRQWLNTYGEVEYTHCPPSYSSEPGFLSSFTSTELALVKTVTQKAYLNEQENHRTGYVDGGSREIKDSYQLESFNFDYSDCFYQNVTDRFFFLNQEQIYSIYLNNPTYLKSSGWYWTRIARTTGASYNNVGVLINETDCGTLIAAEKSGGIRPAFYLNVTLENEKHKHYESLWIIDQKATCSKQGAKHTICLTCGITIKSEVIEKANHNKILHDKKASTCTENGWSEYETCSQCDYTTFQELQSTGHNYNINITPPTCSNHGYTTYTCDCGDSYISDYIDSFGHTEVVDNAVPPTCTATGLSEGRHCSICNEIIIVQEIISALDHDYITNITQPTCTEKGYTTYTCKCGASYISNYVKATGHSYSEWIIIKEATKSETGFRERICHCGNKQIEEIPKIKNGQESIVIGCNGNMMDSSIMSILFAVSSALFIFKR